MLHFDLPFLSKSCNRVEEVSSGVLQSCVDFNTIILLARVRIAVSCGNGTVFRYLSIKWLPGSLKRNC